MFSIKHFSQIILVLLSSFLFMNKAEAGVMVTNLRVSRTRIAIPDDRTFPNNFDSRINISFKITNTWDTPIEITGYSISVFDDDSFNMEDQTNDLLFASPTTIDLTRTLQSGEMTQIDRKLGLFTSLLNDAIERNPDEGNALELFISGSVTFTEQNMEHIDFFNTETVPPNTCTAPTPTPENRTSASEICRVPEPTSTLSLLALGTLGAASTLKCKQNPKPTEKEPTKVG